MSQVLESAVFSGIRIAQFPESERRSGVAVVDTKEAKIAGFPKFQKDVHEVFAVCILPRAVSPDAINHEPELIRQSYVLPDEALAEVPSDFRSTSWMTENPPKQHPR
jgi:hypothetical protein